MGDSTDWLVPDWPAPEGVRAVCTTRSGGVSQGALGGLNLGGHVGDAPVNVAANRAQFGAAIGVRPVFLQQVHGTEILPIDAATPDGAVADACTTVGVGVACTIMVADCLPVLFTDSDGRRVAAAHAGWRGLAGGVLEGTTAAFGGTRPMAWLGPCIGPNAFEVGDEVRTAFVTQSAEADACFRPGPAPGKWWADLPALARQRLRAAGVEAVYGNDGSDVWCTVRNPLRFFSHRRDGGSGPTGRFAAAIWRD